MRAKVDGYLLVGIFFLAVGGLFYSLTGGALFGAVSWGADDRIVCFSGGCSEVETGDVALTIESYCGRGNVEGVSVCGGVVKVGLREGGTLWVLENGTKVVCQGCLSFERKIEDGRLVCRFVC